MRNNSISGSIFETLMSEQAWTDSYRDDYEDLLLSEDTPENDDGDGQPEIVVGNNTIKCVRGSAADDLYCTLLSLLFSCMCFVFVSVWTQV